MSLKQCSKMSIALPRPYAYLEGRTRVSISRYWELKVPDDGSLLSDNNSNLIHEFRGRFEDVIRLHLRSDVPVGTSLSGGLDFVRNRWRGK